MAKKLDSFVNYLLDVLNQLQTNRADWDFLKIELSGDTAKKMGIRESDWEEVVTALQRKGIKVNLAGAPAYLRGSIGKFSLLANELE